MILNALCLKFVSFNLASISSRNFPRLQRILDQMAENPDFYGFHKRRAKNERIHPTVRSFLKFKFGIKTSNTVKFPSIIAYSCSYNFKEFRIFLQFTIPGYSHFQMSKQLILFREHAVAIWFLDA